MIAIRETWLTQSNALACKINDDHIYLRMVFKSINYEVIKDNGI